MHGFLSRWDVTDTVFSRDNSHGDDHNDDNTQDNCSEKFVICLMKEEGSPSNRRVLGVDR